MMDSSYYNCFFTSQSYLSTANFTDKYGDGTNVRYSTYRSSMLVQYSTLKYRPCNTTQYCQTKLCCRPSNSTKYKSCNLKMHNLFKLLKVLLLSFIIMMGTDGSNTPWQSGRLNEVNNNKDDDNSHLFLQLDTSLAQRPGASGRWPRYVPAMGQDSWLRGFWRAWNTTTTSKTAIKVAKK